MKADTTCISKFITKETLYIAHWYTFERLLLDCYHAAVALESCHLFHLSLEHCVLQTWFLLWDLHRWYCKCCSNIGGLYAICFVFGRIYVHTRYVSPPWQGLGWMLHGVYVLYGRWLRQHLAKVFETTSTELVGASWGLTYRKFKTPMHPLGDILQENFLICV